MPAAILGYKRCALAVAKGFRKRRLVCMASSSFEPLPLPLLPPPPPSSATGSNGRQPVDQLRERVPATGCSADWTRGYRMTALSAQPVDQPSLQRTANRSVYNGVPSCLGVHSRSTSAQTAACCLAMPVSVQRTCQPTVSPCLSLLALLRTTLSSCVACAALCSARPRVQRAAGPWSSVADAAHYTW